MIPGIGATTMLSEDACAVGAAGGKGAAGGGVGALVGAASGAAALVYGEAVDPFSKASDIDEGPFFVYDTDTEQVIFEGSHYPGARRTGEWELTYESDDIMDIMLAYNRMRR